MNELDLTNTQAVVFMMVLIWLTALSKPPRPQKSAQFERENQQTIETPSEDLSPDYGRYIQLAGVNVWGGTELSLSENDKRVLRLIKVGAENSITGAEISLITKPSRKNRARYYQPSNHAP